MANDTLCGVGAVSSYREPAVLTKVALGLSLIYPVLSVMVFYLILKSISKGEVRKIYS